MSAEVARHFQQRPAHPYTRRWSSKQLLLKTKSALGVTQLQTGATQYGTYAPVALTWDAIQWNEDPFSNLNWQWFHHQLMSVHHLLAAAHFETPNALPAAKQILRSWAAANYQPTFPSPLAWDDHVTAFRLRTLLCSFEWIRSAEPLDAPFLDHLLRMIASHCRVLATEEFFNRHTNHGFDQATILYWAASAFPELSEAAGWLQLSQDRLREEIDFMFTPEGIHVENSPGYHVWLLMALEEYLLMTGDQPPPELEARINAGWDYAACLLQPDGRLPIVGDTASRDFATLRSVRPLPGAQNFIYSATRGKSGTRPSSPDGIFPQSGYAILRDAWHPTDRFSETLYLFFKCSFFSDYHRHDDDLHFALIALGEEWFIDSGLYGYEERHPLRRYMRSNEAHNTVIPEGSVAIRTIARHPSPGSGIVEHGVQPECTHVTARSLSYPGWVVERRLEYRRPHHIRLLDSVQRAAVSNHPPSPFTILFHVPTDKRITVQPDGRIQLASAKGDKLILAPTPVPHRITLVTGESPDGGITAGSHVSYRINTAEPSQCLRLLFHGTTNSEIVLTLIPAPPLPPPPPTQQGP